MSEVATTTGQMGVERSDVSVEGVRSVVYDSSPRGSREAVVFLHGNPGSAADWTQLLPQVSKLARAIALDLPGYGQADRPRAFSYTIAAYARHIAGLLSQLGVERAHLVLHDFGVPWGLAWACQTPEAVASVTLFNCGVLPGFQWHMWARIWRTPLLGELTVITATRSVFRFLVKRENPRLPDAFIDRMYDDLNWGTRSALLRLYRATAADDAGSNAYAATLARLQVPALVLWGGADSNMNPDYAQAQRQFFGATEVHVLEGAGHWPFAEEPERCADLVVAFLRAQLAR